MDYAKDLIKTLHYSLDPDDEKIIPIPNHYELYRYFVYNFGLHELSPEKHAYILVLLRKVEFYFDLRDKRFYLRDKNLCPLYLDQMLFMLIRAIDDIIIFKQKLADKQYYTFIG